MTSYQGNAPIANNLYGVANGTSSNVGYITVFMTRDPTSNDINYQVKQRWINTVTPREWILTGFMAINSQTTAIWLELSDGNGLLEFTGGTGTTGFPVFPNSAGQVELTSNLQSIAITGTPNSINFDIANSTPTSWTPTAFGGTVAGTFTPIVGGATGTYCQIGSLVFIQFATLGTISGSASGDFIIGNLPVTVNTNFGNSFGACVIEGPLTWPTTTNITTSLAVFGNVGTKTCSIYCSVSGGGGGNLQIADTLINVQGSLVYFS